MSDLYRSTTQDDLWTIGEDSQEETGRSGDYYAYSRNLSDSEDDSHDSEDDSHDSEDDSHDLEDDSHDLEDDSHDSEDDAHDSEDDSHDSEDDSEQEDLFEGTDEDDIVELLEHSDVFGGDGADHFKFAVGSHARITDFDVDEGDLVVFDTGNNLSGTEELAQYVTKIEYENNILSVEFGEYGSIELVGVRADQVSWDLVDVVS